MAIRAGRTTSDPDQADLFFVPFYASSSRTASQLATANLYTQLITHLRASAPYWDRYGLLFALGVECTGLSRIPPPPPGLTKVVWLRCRYGGHDHVFVLGRHYTERTAFGRASMALVLHETPIFITFELTNYNTADLSSHMWRMARNVIMPRPDPFAHLSSPECAPAHALTRPPTPRVQQLRCSGACSTRPACLLVPPQSHPFCALCLCVPQMP